MIVPVLTEIVELLSILINGVRSLFEVHQLPHLCINVPPRDIGLFQSLFEFSPSDLVALWLHRFKMLPPNQRFTPKLLSGEAGLVLL
jgi:hypothetical protein